jgi:hypothetical protein
MLRKRYASGTPQEGCSASFMEQGREVADYPNQGKKEEGKKNEKEGRKKIKKREQKIKS